MRLHTDTLTSKDLWAALLPGMGFDSDLFQYGSRSRDHAFEVRLTGSGYRVNTGTHGAGYIMGATWDEWGAFMAALYVKDPLAQWGGGRHPQYRNATDFHYQTAGRFLVQPGVLPHDTHRRHTWDYDPVDGSQRCIRCTATHRRRA